MCDELTELQKTYVGMLRKACDAIPEGLNITMIVETAEGFFLLGNCCEPCTLALIHTAADAIPDPRDAIPDFDGPLVVVQ